ncbi:MAG: aldo/keto reductase [Haloferacaceae archaeon]
MDGAERVTVGGVELPAVGLGTWRLRGGDCRRAVRTALDLGYRHIDTAQVYGNERQVGAAIEASDVGREEVFLATKLDGSSRRRGAVRRSVEASLSRLGTDYLDLLMIHWPTGKPPGSPVELPVGPPLSETLAAMNDLVADGTVRHLGVSNFGADRLDAARRLSDAPVLADQVQFHPYWDQSDLLSYCRRNDVALTAYSPLCHGGVLRDPVLADVARAHDKSPAQVAIRWAIQHENVHAVPKASTRDHLAGNLDVFDFELTDAEMERIRRPSKLRTAAAFARARLPV